MLLSAIISLITLTQCDYVSDSDKFLEQQRPIFPENSKDFGVEVANCINHAIKGFHKSGIDYSNAEVNSDFRHRFYKDYFQNFPNVNTDEGKQIIDHQFSASVHSRGLSNLTDIQLSVIDMITSECAKSVTYDDFYDVICKINAKICESVPDIQQERLYNITSALYYGMREIQRLESNGYIIPTPNREIKSAVAKSRSESGGSVGGTCRTVLATTWAIALGEPSPFGEIVASVITVAVAGVLMYEVLLCPAGSSNGGSSTDDRWNYCQFKFSRCYSPRPDACGTCLQYCMQQGSWPPVSSHACYEKP